MEGLSVRDLRVWGWINGVLHPLSSGDFQCGPEFARRLARHPQLLSPRLAVVGHDLTVNGEKLDLLALDSDGRWLIVKVAASWLTANDLTAALQQAAVVNALPFDDLEQAANQWLAAAYPEREICLETLLNERRIDRATAARRRELQLCLVGSGQDPAFPRLINYLSGSYNFPLRIVIYNTYQNGDEGCFLTAETVDYPAPAPREREFRVEYGTPIILPGPLAERPPTVPRPTPPPADSPSELHRAFEMARTAAQQAARQAGEFASQIWLRSGEWLGRPPVDISSTYERRPGAVALLNMANARGGGESLRYLFWLAERQALQPIFSTSAVQFFHRSLKGRPLFSARVMTTANGTIRLALDHGALAQVYQRPSDELSKLFGVHDTRDMTYDAVHQFAVKFQNLAKRK
jgi:hypothetical protein